MWILLLQNIHMNVSSQSKVQEEWRSTLMTCEENHISCTPGGFQDNRNRPGVRGLLATELGVLQVTGTLYPARPFCLICLLCHLEGNVLKANISSASQPDTPSRREVVLNAHLWHWGFWNAECPKAARITGRAGKQTNKKQLPAITRSKTDGQEGLLWCYVST